MHQRRIRFRNALIEVALEEAQPNGDVVWPSMMPEEAHVAPPHVLIVDDAFHTRELHRTLVVGACPTARVTTVTR